MALAEELLGAVRKTFTNSADADNILSGISRTLRKSGVSYKEAEEYAARLGELLAKALKENVTAEVLPGGILTEELAEAILRPLLTANYEAAAQAAAAVQTSLNRAAGLGMKGLQANLNTDRIDGLIEKASSYDSFEKAEWVLDEPVVNLTQRAVEDTIRKNTEAHFKAGLSPKVRRIVTGKACKWCKRLDGTYDYPVEREVYRRHERCRCLVLYDPGDGKVQNAHTKVVYDSQKSAVEDAARERRQEKLKKWREQEQRYPEARREIRRRIKSGEYSLELKHQKYLQHAKGTKEYLKVCRDRGKPQSYLVITEKEAQRIIDRYSGLGDPLLVSNGKPGDSEFFSTGKLVGYYHKDGVAKPTDRVQIVHGKYGSHVIPVKPLEINL